MTYYKTIELEINEAENYAILYLNRPNQLNALNFQLNKDFCQAIKEISENPIVRCLVITGRGKAFCAGGDIKDFNSKEDPATYMHNLALSFHDGIKGLKDLNFPSIAFVNGACYGVGLSIACACDLRICAPNAKFAIAFTSIGTSPDSSLTFHLPKIVGLSIANEMALLNRNLTAQEALEYHLVSRILSEGEESEGELMKMINQISNGATLALTSTKRLFIRSFFNDFETQLDEEIENITKNAGTEDFQEGMNSFLEKRRPKYKGK